MRFFFDMNYRAARFGGQLLAVLTIAVLCSDAMAQSTFKHRSADGTVTFSDAPVRNGIVVRSTYRSDKRKPAFANPCKGLTKAHLDARARNLNWHFSRASDLTGVDINLLKAVARAESCFDPRVVSRAGAKGLMQLMPATAHSLEVNDIFDVEQNVSGGARYLSSMLLRYSYNLDLALAAYNAGPGNVDKYNGVPPFRETQRYIVSVKAFMKRYKDLQQRSEGATLAASD